MLNTTTHRVTEVDTGDQFPEPHVDPISVRRFGADEESADNTAAFQRAVDACYAYDIPSTEPIDYSWLEWACLALVIIVVCLAVFYPEVRR